MISKHEIEVLDKCLSECPIEAQLDSPYFTETEIIGFADTSDFDFTRFKRLLSSRSKAYCKKCNEPFDSEHQETHRTKRTVYTLAPKKISEGIFDTAEKTGPLSDIERETPTSGIYRVNSQFGKRNLKFEMFAERDHFLDNELDPFDLEFPVLLRDTAVVKQKDYRFSWRELVSEGFQGKLSSLVTGIKNKTTAVFAEYNEEFVANHRTEIKKSIRCYFRRSGYSVHTEVADECPEIEVYGIDAGNADYVSVNDDEKILITHGSDRDGWYIQRFVDGKLTSVENEQMFVDFHDQIDAKIRRYKKINNQLGSAPQMMRGIGGIVALATVILAFFSADDINTYLQSFAGVSAYSTEIVLGVLALNTLISIAFVIMLVSPYVKEKLFSWDMYSCGASRPKLDILQHSRFGFD